MLAHRIPPWFPLHLPQMPACPGLPWGSGWDTPWRGHSLPSIPFLYSPSQAARGARPEQGPRGPAFQLLCQELWPQNGSPWASVSPSVKWGHRARPGPQVPWIPDSGTLPRAPRLVNKGGEAGTVTALGLWAPLQRAGELVPHRLPPEAAQALLGGSGPWPKVVRWGLGERLRASPRPPAKAAFTAAQRPGAPTLSHSPSPLERLAVAGAQRGFVSPEPRAPAPLAPSSPL